MLKKYTENQNLRVFFVAASFTPIFYNYFFKLLPSETQDFSIDNPDFINLFLSLILFIYIFYVGKSIKKIFDLSSISISIVFYLFSFFIIDNYFLLISKEYTFKEMFIFVNTIWLILFLFNKDLKNFHIILFVFSIFFIQKYLISYFVLNFDLTPLTYTVPDETDVWIPATTYLFENNYYFAINNVSHNGYGLLITHINAVSTNIFYYSNNYMYLPFTKNVFFLLTLLFIYEIKVKNITKIIFVTVLIIVTLNSHWFRYLFFNSMMMENAASYFFGVLLFSRKEELKPFERYLTALLIGILYFSKQFLSFLAIIFLIYLFLTKKMKSRELILGLSPIFISLINSIILKIDITWSNYFKYFDFSNQEDQIITNNQYSFKNIFNIVNQFLIDKPVSYFLFIFLILFLFNLKSNFNKYKDMLYIVFINTILVFVLYITVWSDVEFGSSYRYLMNIFHLLIPIYLVAIDKFIFPNKTRAR